MFFQYFAEQTSTKLVKDHLSWIESGVFTNGTEQAQFFMVKFPQALKDEVNNYRLS